MEQKTETTKTAGTPPGKKLYWWKASASFLMVLFTMPLGHAVFWMRPHCIIRLLPWDSWVC